MWVQAQWRSTQLATGSGGARRTLMTEVKEDEEAHAHSPRRPGDENGCAPDEYSNRFPDNRAYWPSHYMPPPQSRPNDAAWVQTQQRDADVVRQNGPLADPFLDSAGARTAPSRRRLKRSTEDTPMPDVPASEASRSISGMTGVSYEHKEVAGTIPIASHEAIMNQLVEALSPLKSDDDSGPPHVASSAPVFSKDSAFAQVSPTSRVEVGTARETPEVGLTEKRTEETSRHASRQFLSADPGGSVHSKKETGDNKENTPESGGAGSDFGRQSSLGGITTGTETFTASGDSSRKRPLRDVSASNNPDHATVSTSLSPSKKVSKKTSADALRKDRSPHTPGAGRDMSGGVSLAVAVGSE